MSKDATLVVIQFVLLGLEAVALLLLPKGGTDITRVVGVAMAVLGLLVALYAIYEHQRANRQLPNVVPIPKETGGLITSGLYQWVRHPIYTGVLLGAFGIAVFQWHIMTALLAIALYGLFSVKSRYEENLLKIAFPEYAAYMTRTGRFFPGINL